LCIQLRKPHGQLRIPRRSQYIRRDNKILNVAKFLNSKPDKGARIIDAQKELERIYIVSQGYDDIQDIMLQMCNWKWAIEDVYGRTKIYKITNVGKQAVHDAVELIQKGHPLANLDAFSGLVRD
jgi:DNA-binding PadR family transcriptional regulator